MKVKTTAQQEEEKKKEREKKLKIYVSARDACFSKVSSDSLYIETHPVQKQTNLLCEEKLH